jgi:hypothetical protein
MRSIRCALTAFATAVTLLCSSAQARNEGSEIFQSGLASVVMSPLLSLSGKPIEASAALGMGVGLTVVGMSQMGGEASMVTLEKASDGSRYMIKVSEVMLKEVGLTVGTSVKTIAESTGYALVASGKLLAFIPNEIGMALLHQSRVSSK